LDPFGGIWKEGPLYALGGRSLSLAVMAERGPSLPLLPFFPTRKLLSVGRPLSLDVEPLPIERLLSVRQHRKVRNSSARSKFASTSTRIESIRSIPRFPSEAESSGKSWKALNAGDLAGKEYAEELDFLDSVEIPRLYHSREEAFWLLQVLEGLALDHPSLLRGLFQGSEPEREASISSGVAKLRLWLAWEGGWTSIVTQANVIVSAGDSDVKMHATAATCLVERAAAQAMGSYTALTTFSSTRSPISAFAWGIRILTGAAVEMMATPSDSTSLLAILFRQQKGACDRRQKRGEQIAAYYVDEDNGTPTIAFLHDFSPSSKGMRLELVTMASGVERSISLSEQSLPRLCPFYLCIHTMPSGWKERTMLFQLPQHEPHHVERTRQLFVAPIADAGRPKNTPILLSLLSMEGAAHLTVGYREGKRRVLSRIESGAIWREREDEENGVIAVECPGEGITIVLQQHKSKEKRDSEKSDLSCCLRIWMPKDVRIGDILPPFLSCLKPVWRDVDTVQSVSPHLRLLPYSQWHVSLEQNHPFSLRTRVPDGCEVEVLVVQVDTKARLVKDSNRTLFKRTFLSSEEVVLNERGGDARDRKVRMGAKKFEVVVAALVKGDEKAAHSAVVELVCSSSVGVQEFPPLYLQRCFVKTAGAEKSFELDWSCPESSAVDELYCQATTVSKPAISNSLHRPSSRMSESKNVADHERTTYSKEAPTVAQRKPGRRLLRPASAVGAHSKLPSPPRPQSGVGDSKARKRRPTSAMPRVQYSSAAAASSVLPLIRISLLQNKSLVGSSEFLPSSTSVTFQQSIERLR